MVSEKTLEWMQWAEKALNAAIAEIDRQGVTGSRRADAIRWAAEMILRVMAETLYKRATDREKARREGHQKHGKTGGETGGFKGGRPSTKPPNIELHEQYAACLAQHGDHVTARADLVKTLHREHDVTMRTASSWLTNAGMPSRK